MVAEKEVKEALQSILGGSATALGYDFLTNPQGFVLAVLWREFTAFMAGAANAAAARAFAIWAIAEQSVIDPLAFALGTPGRVLASMVFGLLDLLNELAIDLGQALGPLGFVAVPVVWGVAVVAAVAAVIGVWRLYKWIRVVAV